MNMTDSQIPDPIFVYGALRSGTTVFRLMLNAHDALSNPGEVDFLFDHLWPATSAELGWRYDIAALKKDRIFRSHDLRLPDSLDGVALLDYMIAKLRPTDGRVLTLNVHRHADKIAAALPEALFIHLLRDPRDVARSSIGMGWAGNSYHGISHWIATETDWDRADIPKDRVLTVHFETLIANVETELSSVCAFLGVKFDPKMLEYYRTTTYDAPDPSIAFGWKRKAAPHEIALIEGRAATLMLSRGYTLHGAPYTPSAMERRVLALENRWKRWRFNVRRYGLPLFTTTHLARLLRLKGLHRRLGQRQEAIRMRTRK